MLKFTLVLAVIILNTRHYSALTSDDAATVTLLPDVEYRCCPENEINRQHPKVYCYHGSSKSLTNVWETVSAYVEMKRPEKYDIYQGVDESDVLAQYESSQSGWGFSIFNWGRKSITLDPFNTTCLGIRTSKNYTLKITVTQVNKLLVGMFALGALLFFLAPLLVQNQIFYYIIGTSVGVLASVLIFLYFIIKLLPLKRPAMLGMMAGGSTVIFYFFQSIVNNILVFMPMYTQLMYGYILVSGFFSFVICYRFGPLSNPRSMNIVQWSLQIISLLLVFFSSYNQRLAVMLAVMIVLLYNLPVIKKIFNSRSNVKYSTAVLVPKRTASRRSPQRKLGLLTSEEYREQGRIETERGLEEIRQYCSARWDQVQGRIDARNFEKLTKFVTGEPHVSKEELEAKIMEDLLTDEEE